MTQPLFLLAIERSGSTLLQRLLASHDQIEAIGETGLLLPYLYSLRAEGIYSEYGHAWAVRAITDFSARLPNGLEDYRAAVRSLVIRLFREVAANSTYFLDKTPAYAYVASELFEVFPDAKVIFLWRNPLAIAASLVESYGRPGAWNVYQREHELTVGLGNLVEAVKSHGHRCMSVRYEALVSNPERELEPIFAYLGLSFDLSILQRFSEVHFEGANRGDLSEAYLDISTESVDKWTRTMSNPLRRLWCHRFLSTLGRDRLAAMGYDFDELVVAIDSTPVSWHGTGSDALRMTYGHLWSTVDRYVLARKGERRWLLDSLAERFR